MPCHRWGVTVIPGVDGYATLSLMAPGESCFASGGGDDSGTTVTVTVHTQSSGLAPFSLCFSVFVKCSDEGSSPEAEGPSSASEGGEAKELDGVFAATTDDGGNGGKGPSVGGPSDEGGPSQKEQIHPNPDAKTAFQNALNNLGRPLGDDAVRSQVKFGPAQGLDNGMREGYRFGWRLEWDPDKGAHFNWFDWTLGGKSGGGGRWGAETFPASEEQVIDMILKFTEGGEDLMLADQ